MSSSLQILTSKDIPLDKIIDKLDKELGPLKMSFLSMVKTTSLQTLSRIVVGLALTALSYWVYKKNNAFTFTPIALLGTGISSVGSLLLTLPLNSSKPLDQANSNANEITLSEDELLEVAQKIRFCWEKVSDFIILKLQQQYPTVGQNEVMEIDKNSSENPWEKNVKRSSQEYFSLFILGNMRDGVFKEEEKVVNDFLSRKFETIKSILSKLESKQNLDKNMRLVKNEFHRLIYGKEVEKTFAYVAWESTKIESKDQTPPQGGIEREETSYQVTFKRQEATELTKAEE